MKNAFRILTALALAGFVAAPLQADGVLEPHRATYKVRISVVSGELNTELQRTEDGYAATHVVHPTGVSRLLAKGAMSVSSTFTNDGTRVRPATYHALDTIRDEPEARIRFDWENSQAVGTVGADPVVLPLDGYSHDSVSIQYQLMLDLMNGEASERYVLFDVEKMRVANITRVGERTVDTRAGRFAVIGIRHQKEGSSRTTTLWCAPELGYLPVIIEQHRKGKVNFRATLSHYEPLST